MSTTIERPPTAAESSFVFDYEDRRTVEGRGQVRVNTHDLAALRLARCLAALRGASGALLEIGCGAGRNLRAFRHYRPDLVVHGVDLSQVALDEARALGGQITYARGDALHLPYPDATFDIVVLFDLLEHVPDVDAAVAEIARVLKPGGRFHGFVPCEGNPHTFFATLRHSRRFPIHRWKRDHIGHIQILTTNSLRRLLTRRDLTVSDLTYSFHLMGQIHDLVDYWQREQLAGPRPATGVQRLLVRAVSRSIFWPTWRLAYYEDNWRRHDPWAVGVHVTALRNKPL